MLKNLAAALIASALIAGPAFAAQPLGDASAVSGAAPTTVVARTGTMHMPSKSVMRLHRHKRWHVAHHRTFAHAKPTRLHRGHLAEVIHVVKPGTSANTAMRPATIRTAKLHATQSISR